jgi:ketosteroid isomerase-like protein
LKIIFRIVFLAVIVAAGIWLWNIFFPGPEQIIRRELSGIARDASFNPNESPLIGVAHAQTLAGFFSPNVEVKLDAPLNLQRQFESREEIAQTYLGTRSLLGGGLKVEFVDVNVTVATDKQSALADLTARVKIGSNSDMVVQEIKFTLQKTDGKWLITRVETIRPFS